MDTNCRVYTSINTMYKIALIWISMIFSLNCLAQKESVSEVFSIVIKENITNAKFYIGCEKSKTVFENVNFNEKTGLEVPSNILEQLRVASIESIGGNWISVFPPKSKIIFNKLKSYNCLSREKIDELFDKRKKQQSIFLISEPLFDENMEHCIISFTCIRYKGSAYGNSYFLKKVYGSWTIIAVFDSWTS